MATANLMTPKLLFQLAWNGGFITQRRLYWIGRAIIWGIYEQAKKAELNWPWDWNPIPRFDTRKLVEALSRLTTIAKASSISMNQASTALLHMARTLRHGSR